MAKEKEPKMILEREYIIPLRKEWLKVPQYKRANKAVKAIKEFLVRHMKLYERDLKDVKIDKYLNNEIRFRGMRKPLAKVKVKARKYDDGIVKVELAEVPQVVRYKMEKEKKFKAQVEEHKAKKATEKKLEEKIDAEKKGEEKEELDEKKEDREEKKAAVKEEGALKAKQQAKQVEHTAGKQKQPIPHRMALQK
jgi:large subunit ribosomal protein L31e